MKENTDILMKPEAKLEDRFTNKTLTMEGFKEPAGDISYLLSQKMHHENSYPHFKQ